jgi:hypothetical protein
LATLRRLHFLHLLHFHRHRHRYRIVVLDSAPLLPGVFSDFHIIS